MWKNVFIESCILSALVFGGFYLNTLFIKSEISETQTHIQNESSQGKVLAHISGNSSKSKKSESNSAHICGEETSVKPVSPISGAEQPPMPAKPLP
jgi:hypothetical protein